MTHRPLSAEDRVWYANWLSKMGMPRADKVVEACEEAGMDTREIISRFDSYLRYCTLHKSFDPENRGAPFTPINLLAPCELPEFERFQAICQRVNTDLVDRPKT